MKTFKVKFFDRDTGEIHSSKIKANNKDEILKTYRIHTFLKVINIEIVNG